MTKVYIVPHPAHSTGQPVEHHEIKKAGGEVLHRERTQEAAIEWAEANGHTAHVARERDTKPDPNNPEHWRKH